MADIDLPFDPHAQLLAITDWNEQLQSIHKRLLPLFERSEPRKRLLTYLQGLLSKAERKNGWHLAEQAGDRRPDGVQRFLNAAHWDENALRNELRTYVLENLESPHAVGILDETGFLKKGTESVGVKRQYSGTAGRIENCQIGVFLVYASEKGHTFLDRALYLPEEWASDLPRRLRAGIPEEIEFATKPKLARHMLERALNAGVQLAWVTGDEVYGKDRKLRLWLESQSQPFVLAIPCNEPLWVDFKQTRANQIPILNWQIQSAGSGTKGQREYEWACVPLVPPLQEEMERWLLVRRSISDPEELAYYAVFGLKDSRLEDLVKVAGSRWKIEECFETAKGEVGLDEYEVRKWTAWHRHITLAMWAHAFLTVLRSQGCKKKEVFHPPKAQSLAKFKRHRQARPPLTARNKTPIG